MICQQADGDVMRCRLSALMAGRVEWFSSASSSRTPRSGNSINRGLGEAYNGAQYNAAHLSTSLQLSSVGGVTSSPPSTADTYVSNLIAIQPSPPSPPYHGGAPSSSLMMNQSISGKTTATTSATLRGVVVEETRAMRGSSGGSNAGQESGACGELDGGAMHPPLAPRSIPGLRVRIGIASGYLEAGQSLPSITTLSTAKGEGLMLRLWTQACIYANSYLRILNMSESEGRAAGAADWDFICLM